MSGPDPLQECPEDLWEFDNEPEEEGGFEDTELEETVS